MSAVAKLRDAALGQSMMRSSDAMLKSLGAAEVWLRLPSPAVADATEVQLGLAAPQVDDVLLAPAAALSLSGDPRQRRLRYELLVSASAVSRVLEERGVERAEVLFNSALGVLLGPQLLHIEGMSVETCAGVTTLYRLTVAE